MLRSDVVAETGSDALVGRTFGEFVVRQRIGEGGFGAVYRAVQPLLDREAVLKVLHARLRNSKATDRFLREAKLASKLDHPYAAHIYAFGAEPDGQLWIAMELVRGSPLDQLLATQGPLPLERFVPLLDRICEVVHTAHEQGIVHRDLKPANVMVLSRAGRLLPKLLDFGIAKALDHTRLDRDSSPAIETPPALGDAQTIESLGNVATDGALTQRGSVIGSPLYMAPEQWMDAASVDARTDIYALGVLAIEALTGTPPFTGKSTSAIARAHAKQPPPSLGPKFPHALDAVLARALAKRPEDRYASVLELAQAFREASGITADAVVLPQLDEDVREQLTASAPQPIAEAVASLEAARNVHQARDALWQVLRTVCRYLGLVALASRTRVGHGRDHESSAVLATLRTLYRRSLSDEEWLELANELVRPFRSRRDVHPMPELVELLEAAPFESLFALHAETVGDDELPKLLARGVEQMSALLRKLAFLGDYALVVPVAGSVAERWTGARRSQRATTPITARSLPVGEPALIDRTGAPVLSLYPLFQVAAPTPGAPLELFLFDGRGRRSAKLVALPSQFEHHDDTLWDWFRTQLGTSLDEATTGSTEGTTPYRGLSSFSTEDAALFFGREELVDAFANRLRVQPLLAVVGPSGAGKSSFVQAGVVPALPEHWRAFSMRPGASPIAALRARLDVAGIAHDGLSSDDSLGEALRHHAESAGPMLFVVDQLEELFTLCLDVDERRRFAEMIVRAARSIDDPVRVVLTLRDDFLVRAEQLPAFRTRIGQGLQLVTVPAEDDLVRILVEPARRAGYELEDPQLATDMVREVVEQPGALALLSFTASKLWELRDRHFKQLTRRAYDSLGGVGGALAQHAEKTLDSMLPEERRLVREVFRHLVTSQNTRATLARTELHELLGDRQHGDAVLEKLIAARLLVSSEGERGEDRIEIIHEALLGAWPRLVEWTREDAEGARLRDQLRAAAKQWQERSRSRGLLWRGDALVDYERWRARHPSALTDLEQAFANASLADARRGRRIRQTTIVVAFVALTVGLAVLVRMNRETERQRSTAEEQRELAQDNARKAQERLAELFQEQGRQAALDNDPMRALRFLHQARREGASGSELQLLLGWAAQRLEGQIAAFEEPSPVSRASISEDGRHVLSGMRDGTVALWEVDTGKRHVIAMPRGTSRRAIARFIPGSQQFIVASGDTLSLHDIASRKLVREWTHGGDIVTVAATTRTLVSTGMNGTVKVWGDDGTLRHELVAHAAAPYAIALDPRGEIVVTGDEAGQVHVARTADGKLVARLSAHTARVSSVAFSASGETFATAGFDGHARIWSREGKLRVDVAHSAELRSIAFDDTGERIVIGGDDRTARIASAKTGRILHVLEMAAPVYSTRFDPSGTRVLTTTAAGGVQMWDAASGSLVWSFLGHTDAVWEAVFDGSGRRFVTPSLDQTVRIWDATQADHVALTGHKGDVWSSDFSPDGTLIATAASDGLARIYNFPSGQLAHAIPFGMAEFGVAVFAPNSKRIALAGADGAAVFELVGGRRAFALEGITRVTYLAYSPSGDRLATGGEDGSVRLWNAETGAPLATLPPHKHEVWAVAFSPDGKLLASAGRDTTVKIWDLAGPTLLATLPHKLTVATVAFSKDGSRLVTGGEDKLVWIWTLATREGRALEGHTSVISTAELAPDERFLVSASHDGTVRIWDVASGHPVVEVGSRTSGTFSARFAPDNRYVVTSAREVRAWRLPRLDVGGPEVEDLVACRLPIRLRPKDVAPCAK